MAVKLEDHDLYKLGTLRRQHRELITQALEMSLPGLPLVEIGSLIGRSAVYMVQELRRLGKTGNLLYCVEPHARAASLSGKVAYSPKDRREFYRNMVKAGTATDCALIGLPSLQASRAFDAGSLGMIYFDGDHRYPQLCRDLVEWLPKMAPGAPVLFDDYVYKRGKKRLLDVSRACKEAIERGELEEVRQHDSMMLCRRPREE